MQSVECVVVGDSKVGKTSMITRYATNYFPPENYQPCMMFDYSKEVSVNGKITLLNLYDTASQKDYARLRTLSYPGKDVFLVCFSVMCPPSFENVQVKWVPEIRPYLKSTPFLLIGTKLDLRNNRESMDELREAGMCSISYNQGLNMAKLIGAEKYAECSALSEEGLTNVFEQSVQTVLFQTKSRKNCAIL